MNIIKAVVGKTGINVTSNHGYTTMTGVAAWDNFNHDFFKATTFPDRMRIYADMREQYPEHKDDLYLSPFIDYRYHQAYDLLGGDKLRALRYREKDIAEAVCRDLAAAFPKSEIICGDPREHSLLESEDIGKTDALVALTALDELNLMMSLYGKRREVPLLITKLEYLDAAGLMGNVPLGSHICPRKLCCNNVVRYVRAMQNQVGAAITIHSIADGQAEALEFLVDENTLYCDTPLKKLKFRPNILLVGITSKNGTEIPNGNSVYHVGDSVVLVAGGDTVIGQFNDIFE